MVRFIILSILLSTTLFLSAQINTWVGSVNNQWNNSDNWSLNRVPITTDDIVIAQTINQPILSNNTTASIGNLTISTNATLEIQNGDLIVNQNLSIDGSLSISSENGIIKLGGNWTNNGSFSSGEGKIVFNGDADQFINSIESEECFADFIIDKPSGEVRPNCNLKVFGDFELLAGIFSRSTLGLTHHFYGDFTVHSGGYYPDSSSTTIFAGPYDQYFERIGGGTMFGNVIIQKSEADLTKNHQLSKQTEKNRGMTLYLKTLMVVFSNAATTINEGTLNLNGKRFKSTGAININSGGKMVLTPNSELIVFSEIYVNAGGILSTIGSADNKNYVMRDSAGNYIFQVKTGGKIEAEHTIFQDMDANGIQILDGAIVDENHSFHHCIFQSGESGGTLLQIENNQDIVINSAEFPANIWNGNYNVTKTLNQGSVTFVDFTGDFAGENYENDTQNRVHWGGLTAPENVTIQINGNDVVISWDTVTGATSYQVYSAVSPTGTFGIDTSGILSGTTWTAPLSESIKRVT